MNLLKLALIISFMFTTFTVVANKAVVDEKGVGEKLLRQIWTDMKKPEIKVLEKTLAKGFQSVHQYGANNRKQEIELIKGLNLGEYKLSKIKITRNGPVVIATYFVSVAETIKGKRLLNKPAPRLSIFLKTADGWKWIAHANLKPLK